MKKIFFVLVIFISACGYQTESSMTIDEMLEIKDPCVIVDEYQRAVKDYLYFVENPVGDVDISHPSGRVSDVIFSFIYIFNDDSITVDYNNCPNYVLTKDMMMQDMVLQNFFIPVELDEEWD
ncbi:MAG: hypothetical protein P8I52_00860, partial [Flavobacteriales bacterium]|nr:hypothetical protein [Flavobacteriales bacterium]